MSSDPQDTPPGGFPTPKKRRHRVIVERPHQHTNLEDFARMVRAKYTQDEIRAAFRVLVLA